MPGWHEASKDLQAQGKVQVVGIIEEQHPERARLFMQWKEMGWPIMVDSFNLLDMKAVPVTLILDEYGLVRVFRPKLDELPVIEQDLLNRSFDRPAGLPERRTTPPDLAQLQAKTNQGGAETWRAYGLALSTWAGPPRLDEALAALHQARTLEPDHAPTHFYLGVVYRQRFDSDYRQAGDFQAAVDHWGQALELDPNNYIWRRRIQQYGPRLDKPYPFYDWVFTAREEIQGRGETPLPLAVEPGGAEFSHPVKAFETQVSLHEEPDPAGQIIRDEGQFIEAETTTVPATIGAERVIRVNITLRPNQAVKAHWNNEVDQTLLWIDVPANWEVDNQALTLPNPPDVVSQETRSFEFEMKPPENGASTPVAIPVYALYYVCEDVHGTCLYRRQDLEINITI